MLKLQRIITNALIYQGPNSQVFRAVREQCGTPVVIKIPAKEQFSIRENLRFQHEYNLLASLNLSRIIKVHELVQYRSGFAIVEEDYGAIDISRHLAASRLDLHSFFSMAIQMAEALEQLHGCHIIHKDIHLANFLIHPDTGEVKLTDFGLSTLIQSETQEACNPDLIEGNLPYMSPEQTGRMNRAIDFRSDLYSLGVCYYRLLTGVMPFSSDDPMELVHCHIARQPTQPLHLTPQIPPALSGVIMKLMEKRAERRYQTAQGLLNDLVAIRAAWLDRSDSAGMQLGKRDISPRFQVAQKIYGREKEINLLLEAFKRVAAGGTELLLVGGYSGIGKTALVNEVHKGLAGKHGRFISGKHDQFQRDIPFSAFIQAFRGLVSQILAEPDERVEHWRQSLLHALGANIQVIAAVIPEIECIVGQQPAPPDLGPTEAQNRFALSFKRFIGVFARPEHPLVIFLDDLQWADTPSLDLMRLISAASDMTCLLILGAYRDNEVSPVHPLMATLGQIREDGASPGTLSLAPLTLDDLNNLLSDTLNSSASMTDELARLLQEKTGGNPFFVSQLLKELYELGLFSQNREDGSWHWDMEQVRAVGITDNVVQLMADKIQRMGPRSMQALRLAACIGNRFSLPVLATIIEKSERDAGDDLWEAMHAGLILQTERGFRFLHDRVQQAAYSLIAPNDIAPLHLKIGRLLLAGTGETQLDELIFDIIGHFNLAEQSIVDPEERLSCAEMNLKEGRKGKASTAYEPALHHLLAASRLLTRDAWESHYRLAMDIHRELADVEYLLGHFENAELLLDKALAMSIDKYDRATIHLQKIIQYNQQGRYNDLMDVARESLALFGVAFPRADDEEALHAIFVRQMEDFRSTLGSRTISDLIEIDEVSDLDQDYIISLMAILTDSAYIAMPTLFPYVVMEVVTRSMHHGYNAMSAVGFAWSTVVIVQQDNDYLNAYELGRLSMRLIERFPNPRIGAQVTFLYAVCSMHWVHPLSEQIEMYKRAYQLGVENGNLVFAGYARTMIPKTVLAAFTVDEALKENEISIAFYERRGSPFLMSECFCGLFLKNLKGERTDPISLSTNEYDENTYLALWQQPETLFGHGLAYFLNFKLQLLYLFGEHRKAWEFATAHAEWMRYIPILYETTVFNFYRAMAAAAVVLDEMDDQKRSLMMSDVRKACEDFACWAGHCRENFAWPELLLRAESRRLSGQTGQAFELYKQAAQTARLQNRHQGVALSQELAGMLSRRLGMADVAKARFEDAAFHYFRWGAHAKAQHLHRDMGGMTPQRSIHAHSIHHAGSLTSESTSSETLDLNTVLKSSQAISGEIHLDGVLRVIMNSVLKNAGAETACLILTEGEEWFIAAQSSAFDMEIHLQRHQLANSPLVSEAIVRYVIRTRKDLILEDACQHPSYKDDQHIMRSNVRSLLCLPLLSRNRLSGVLYLENNLAPGVFVYERTSLLKMLSVQAAISIENAKLYENLTSSEQKYRGIFENASDLILLTDTSGRIADSNPACHAMLGYSREELLQLNMSNLFADPLESRRFFSDIERAGTVRGCELTLHHKDGTLVDTMATAGPRRDSHDHVIGYQALIHDITDRKQAERLRAAYSKDLERQVAERTSELSEANIKLQNLSERDGLTGVANRRKFDTVFDVEWKRAIRQGTSLALAMIDVDHFKNYNDLFSHQAGDECLKKVARSLEEMLWRPSDLVAQYGGEEFVVILPNLLDNEAMRMMGERFRKGVESLGISHPGNSASDVVTISIGIASTSPSHSNRPEALLKEADSSLYQAKRGGRNRVMLAF